MWIGEGGYAQTEGATGWRTAIAATGIAAAATEAATPATVHLAPPIVDRLELRVKPTSLLCEYLVAVEKRIYFERKTFFFLEEDLLLAFLHNFRLAPSVIAYPDSISFREWCRV